MGQIESMMERKLQEKHIGRGKQGTIGGASWGETVAVRVERCPSSTST